MPHISLAAEKLTRLWGVPITNSLVTTWLVMAILIALSALGTRRLRLIPDNIQSIAELIVGGLYDFFASVAGKHIKLFFPLLASLFIFIIVSNWTGLLPGVGTVGYFRTEGQSVLTQPAILETAKQIEPATGTKQAPAQVTAEETGQGEKEQRKFIPIFRGPTSDLNTTLALAVLAVIMIQYYGFKTLGMRYSTRFINFANPIMFFLGILEIVSELSKIMSFAFRLFGNIFAGEVLLGVIAFLIPFIVPLPFLAMELFVGFIQALVFSMLTAVFLNVAISHGEEHEGGR